MTDITEQAHRAAEAQDRRIALLIAILALLLAFAETGSKSTQTEALGANIQASDFWAFYQAKTIRETLLQTASELAKTGQGANGAATEAQIKAWSGAIAKLQSDPKSGEGRKELVQKAQRDERRRDVLLASNHQFELSSAAFQIAIVLASATLITGVRQLSWLAGALGVLGGAFLLLAFLAPTALPFF